MSVKSLRIRLTLSGELQRVPWEFMAINWAGGEITKSDFLVFDPAISIVAAKQNSLIEDMENALPETRAGWLVLAKAVLQALAGERPQQNFNSGGQKIDARDSKGFIANNSGEVKQHFGDKIDTGSGAYIGGNVSVKGDFVGRDKIVNNSASSQRDPAARKRAALIAAHFDSDDIDGMCSELEIEARALGGDSIDARAAALVAVCQRTRNLAELKALIREARPALADDLQ